MSYRARKRAKRLFLTLWVLIIFAFLANDLWNARQPRTSVTSTESGQQTENRAEESESSSQGDSLRIPEISHREENPVLPSSYSYISQGKKPKVQNQEQLSWCWAFAALTALETSKSLTLPEVYSAEHLVDHNTFEMTFSEGGSYNISLSYLLAWKGPVLETDDPFDGISVEGARVARHVQEVRIEEEQDYEAIKRFIYLYGGVESAIYVDFDGDPSESECYNTANDSYCYEGASQSNHDIVILGWDDAYAAENFRGDVQRDGAFLCQSSWGSEFGNEGTFYVSYEDVNIGQYGVAYSRVDDPNNYDLIYQSDLCGYTAQVGYNTESCYFANVYTAEEAVDLRAAGFYTTGKDSEYVVYVIPEYEDEKSFEKREYVTSGYLQDEGYYTIDFPEPVSVEAGNDFAVAVYIKTENAVYPAAVECQVEGFSDYADISDGQSYLSYQGMSWQNIEETGEYNICLKAYADRRGE